MPEQTIEAAPQPAVAQAAQPSGEKNNGAGNQTVSQYARRFINPEVTPAAVAETAEKPAGETTVPETATPIPAETGPEPEPKVEIPPEATDKEKADEVLSKSTSQIEFTPEQQEVFNKRLGKEVAKRKELERKLEEANARVAATPPAPEPKQEPAAIVPLPVGAPPLANINDVRGLLELQQQAKEAIRFAEDALAAESDGEPIPDGFTRKSLRDVIRNAKLTVEDHIPARNQFLQAKNQNQQTAYELLPFLKDKSDPNYVLAETFRRNNPWLQNLPASDLMVGMYIKGVEAVKAEREAAEKAKAAPVGGKKVTAKPTGAQTEVSSGGGSERTTAGTQNKQALQAANERLKAKGSVSAKDYASYLVNTATLRTR